LVLSFSLLHVNTLLAADNLFNQCMQLGMGTLNLPELTDSSIAANSITAIPLSKGAIMMMVSTASVMITCLSRLFNRLIGTYRHQSQLTQLLEWVPWT